MFDALPEAFGSYRVLEAIGPGRFGPAYRGRHEETGLIVAIKTFDQGLTTDQAERLAAMLDRLGQAQLDHPAIGHIVAAGVSNECAWLAEPWVDGIPLDVAMQRDGALPVGDVIFRVTQVAAALDFAAAVDIHHGALHPRDILLTADRTVVLGIGVLQALGDAGLHVPMDGAYVSPQRSRGLPVAAADDVFSLAAITYELIHGTPVPEGSAFTSEANSVVGVDKARLADILDRALSREPGERMSTALEFAAALQSAAAAAPGPVAAPAPAPVATPTPVATPAPVVAKPPPVPSVDDLPLRAQQPERKAEPPVVAPARMITEPPVAPPRPHRKPKRRFRGAVAAGIALLLIGFVAGFVIGQRDMLPPAREKAQPTRGASSSEGTPTSTAGRDYTDSTVASPRSGAGRTGEGAAGRPEAGRAEQPQVPPADSQPAVPAPARELNPGVLQVDSRPRGASVFIDGHLVGITPIVVPNVRPGDHAVRIDLVGHRRWVTAVRIEPGERERVAASLER